MTINSDLSQTWTKGKLKHGQQLGQVPSKNEHENDVSRPQ